MACHNNVIILGLKIFICYLQLISSYKIYIIIIFYICICNCTSSILNF
jgi:hypothetical protein